MSQLPQKGAARSLNRTRLHGGRCGKCVRRAGDGIIEGLPSERGRLSADRIGEKRNGPIVPRLRVECTRDEGRVVSRQPPATIARLGDWQREACIEPNDAEVQIRWAP